MWAEVESDSLETPANALGALGPWPLRALLPREGPVRRAQLQPLPQAQQGQRALQRPTVAAATWVLLGS